MRINTYYKLATLDGIYNGLGFGAQIYETYRSDPLILIIIKTIPSFLCSKISLRLRRSVNLYGYGNYGGMGGSMDCLSVRSLMSSRSVRIQEVEDVTPTFLALSHGCFLVSVLPNSRVKFYLKI